MSCLVSRSRRCINEIPMRFVNVLCQHRYWEAGRLVLEDDFSGVVSLLLVEPSPGIEDEKVRYMLILRESFPARVTPRDDAKSESPPY